MPFLEGPFAFTGKLDMLSAYRMRGVDKIVVRRKGGPSAEKIKTSESFKNTRYTMSEFGGCSRTGSYVRKAMMQLRRLSDYNFGSDINSVMRQVQLRDGTSEWGRRCITLSEHTRLLEGFSTTQKAPAFDSIVRAPVYYTLNRADRSARVDIPELLRDINYFPQNNHAMFRLTVTLGIVPDVTYHVPSKEYLPPTWYSRRYNSISSSTDWSPSLEGMPHTTLELAMDALPPDDAWTLMLSIGIEYGSFRQNRKIEQVSRFGAAKIMALQGKDGTSEKNDDDNRIGYAEASDTDRSTASEAHEPIETSQHQPAAHVAPAVRYVYTVKESAPRQPEDHGYGYTIPATMQPVTYAASTTQNAVSLCETNDDVPFSTYLPCDTLKPYVASFMISEEADTKEYKVLPGTNLVIGFQYRGQLVRVDDHAITPLSPAGITGLHDTPRVFRNGAHTGTVLVYFKEAGAAPFFNMPLHELFDESVSLDHFMVRSELMVFEEQLAEARADHDRIALTEKFLMSRLRDVTPDKLVLTALALIHQHKGNLRMTDLAAQLNISQSPLEKRFRQAVGTSPKKFAALVRFQYVVKNYRTKSSLTYLAHDAGFYDQAHFIKTFKSFTGETPDAFFSASG
jgi:AraC-like DNA-binding protein